MQPTIASTTHRSWYYDILSMMALLFIFYFFYLGHYPLFVPDEGRYSEVAREMVATGDYITPRVNGVAFLDKPILYYWLQAAAIHAFGLKEWALRFFPALLGIFGCICTYICGRRLFDRRTGWMAALILASSPLYFGGAHYANLDLEVAVFISCTLLFFITGIQSVGKARTVFLMVAYLFSALAVLTKGLIGIAFPSMIIGAWMLLCWRFNLLKRIHLISGLLLFTLLVLPWYILVQQANPDFLHYFFVTQQVTRFLSNAEFNNQTPFWFYAPIVLVGFFPWTLFLFQSLLSALPSLRGLSLRAAFWRSNPGQSNPYKQTHAIELFLLLWISIIFIFFSIPHSKIIGYILPIFPALALLTGKYIADTSRRINLLPVFFVCLICSSGFLIALVVSATHFNSQTAKPLITQLQKVIKPEDEVVNYFKFYQDTPIYLQRRITLVADWNSPTITQKDNWVRELWYGRAFQPTHDWLINEDIFWKRWHSKKRVFTFVNANYLRQFKTHTKHYFMVGHHNDIILFSNQPVLLRDHVPVA